MKRVMESLQDVCKYLDSIPNINKGGCAISMLAMYRWLQKEDKLIGDEAFVYMFRKEHEVKMFVESLEEGTPFSCVHACLYTGGEYIDSEGEVDISDYYVVQIDPKAEGMVVESVNVVGNWNYVFKRDHILDIENTLNIKMEDVEVVTWNWLCTSFTRVREAAKNIAHPVTDPREVIIGIF